jgi:hypothetical protein
MVKRILELATGLGDFFLNTMEKIEFFIFFCKSLLLKW